MNLFPPCNVCGGRLGHLDNCAKLVGTKPGPDALSFRDQLARMTLEEAQQAFNRWIDNGGEAKVVSVDNAASTVTFGWSENGHEIHAVLNQSDADRLFDNLGPAH